MAESNAPCQEEAPDPLSGYSRAILTSRKHGCTIEAYWVDTDVIIKCSDSVKVADSGLSGVCAGVKGRTLSC